MLTTKQPIVDKTNWLGGLTISKGVNKAALFYDE